MAFETTMGFLGKLFDVQGINEAVNRQQHNCLFVLAIDSLGDRDDSVRV
jgi:hypothetical protein